MKEITSILQNRNNCKVFWPGNRRHLAAVNYSMKMTHCPEQKVHHTPHKYSYKYKYA